MKILKWLDDYFEEVLLVIFLFLITVIMGIQIVARYAFQSSLSWSEEITRFIFIWMGFLSISYCIKKDTSVRIRQFVEMFSEKVMCFLNIVSAVIQSLFFLYMIPIAYKYVMAAVKSHQISPACGIPMYMIQFSALLAFVLSVIRLIQLIWKNIKKLRLK